MDKLRKIYLSGEQRDHLINFMQEEEQLRTGKFSTTFTCKSAQYLWEKVATELNAMPGATKDWKHWRKAWQDMKNKTKGKKATIETNARATGGGPPTDDHLNAEDHKILEMIHPVAITGDMDVPESAVTFDGSFAIKCDDEVVRIIDHDYIPTATPTTSKTSNHTSKNRANLLSGTLSATAKLGEQNQLNIDLKRDYYKQKIEVMKASVIEKRRIATALERIADSLASHT